MYDPGVTAVPPLVTVPIVAVALPEPLTDGGLRLHVGGVAFGCGRTWQVRSTVPVKPVPATSVTRDVADPPGLIANGSNAAIVRVKLWPAEDPTKVKKRIGMTRIAARTEVEARTGEAFPILESWQLRVNWETKIDADDRNLNMSGCWFNYFDS